MPKQVWGLAERDQVTLRQVNELRLIMVFECRNCRHLSEFDTLRLVERFGADATLGLIRKRGTCYICKHRDAEILMKVPSPRSKQAWFPYPPGRWNGER